MNVLEEMNTYPKNERPQSKKQKKKQNMFPTLLESVNVFVTLTFSEKRLSTSVTRTQNQRRI